MDTGGKIRDSVVGAVVALVVVLVVAAFIVFDFSLIFVAPEKIVALSENPLLLVSVGLFSCFVVGSVLYTLWWQYRLKTGDRSKD